MENKLTIEIKRGKDDTFTAILKRNGERHSYPIGSPALEEYNDSIQYLLELMKSTNAGSVKVSF